MTKFLMKLFYQNVSENEMKHSIDFVEPKFKCKIDHTILWNLS